MSKNNQKEIKKDPQENEVRIKVQNKNEDMVGRVYKVENKKSKNMKSFSDFYKNTSNSKNELSMIEKNDPNRKKKFIIWTIVGLIFILGVTIGGLFYFISQEDKFGSESVEFETIIPSLISSGDNVGITITIYNREDVDILDTEFIIQYPKDFTFNSSDPIPNNEANNAWSLGVIKANGSKTINLSGQLFGEMDSSKNFKTIFNYMPENFSSEFQKEYSFDLVINDSVYDLNMTVPTKVVNGFSSPYSVKITNNSEEDVENLRLQLTIPENLTVSSFTPEPDLGTSAWDIDDLKSGEEFEISFNAILEGEEGDVAEIKAEVGYVSSNNEYLVQEEKSAIVFVVDPQMLLTMSVNDSEAGFPVELGDNLKYKILYQNNSQSEIKDLKITASINSELVDWDTLLDDNNGLIENNTIIWTKDQIEGLGSLKTGEGGELEFNISMVDTYNFGDDDEINLSIISNATAVSENVVDLDDGTLEIESNDVENKLSSNLVLRAEGRFYDDEYIKVGDGSLPPEVGSTTKYKIYWFLQNGSNEVEDITVSAILPKDVTWTDTTKVNAGSIAYDPTTRKATWTINKVPEHVGQFLAELQASFEVSITPTSTDLGQVVILLDKTTITAIDTFTNEEITLTQDLISTALVDDPIYVGDGLVVGSTTTNSNSNTNLNVNSNSNTNTE